MTATDPSTTEPRRSSSRLPHWGWFLLATAVLVVVYGPLSIWIPYYQEQKIVRKIDGWGGNVKMEAGGPEWLRQLVSRETMKELKVFDRISEVNLERRAISDEDIAHLRGLTNLEFLDLDHTAVTDAGLAHLRGLTHLKQVYLVGTEVSRRGVDALQKELPDCDIVYRLTGI